MVVRAIATWGPIACRVRVLLRTVLVFAAVTIKGEITIAFYRGLKIADAVPEIEKILLHQKN